MTNTGINTLVGNIAKMMESDESLNRPTDIEKPKNQQELEEYLNARYGEDAWVKVQKVAWCKVIEKAEPGKTYDTVTRDEDKGEWAETTNVAKDGDYLIQNAYGSNHEVDNDKDPSKWLLSGAKIEKNYNVGENGVQVGEAYAPNPIPRKGIQIDVPIVLIAAWGQEMNCKPGDWLVNNGPGDTYRIDKVVFENTYEVG